MVTRSELESALLHYQEQVVRATTEADWSRFADLFTVDARYREHAYGDFEGREQIARWAIRTMTSFPGNAMCAFPPAWSVLDVERGWIVCEIRNIMRDPGDGSVFESPNLTILHYAGQHRFSYEEDVYNPANFVAMVRGWALRCQELGTLTDDARTWLKRYAPPVC